MLDFKLPSVVLREAWSVVRLDVIRETVRRTIVELTTLVNEEEQGSPDGGARRMALHKCTLELMVEVGLEADADSVPLGDSPSSLGWGLDYYEAVDRYRRVAAESLGLALGLGGAPD